MTIESTVNRIQYDGDDVTTAFAFPYLFFDETHLTVILTDTSSVDTELTLTTHYTVTGEGVAGGGTVTMLTEPAAGEVLTILREVPYTQPSNYTNSGTFDQETLEQDLDELTMMTQQLKELSDRSIKLPATSDLSDQIVPPPEADKLLGWNSAADQLENKSVTDGQITIPANAADAKKVLRLTSTGLTVEVGPLMDFDPTAGDAHKIIKVNTAEDALEMAETIPDLVAGDAGKLLEVNSGATGYSLRGLRSFIAGFIPAHDADTEHDMGFGNGTCSNAAGARLYDWALDYVKQIDVTWAVGDDAGGMFTGAVAADTAYHACLIQKDSDASLDWGWDTSISGANTPAGYTFVRRLFSILTDSSSNIINGSWMETAGGGLLVEYLETILDLSAYGAATTRQTLVVSVPTGLQMLARLGIFHFYNSGSASNAWIRSVNFTDVTPGNPSLDLTVEAGTTRSTAVKDVETDTSATLAHRQTQTTSDLYIKTIGFVDQRR